MKKATIEPVMEIDYWEGNLCNQPGRGHIKCPRMRGFGNCLYGNLETDEWNEDEKAMSNIIFKRHSQCIKDEVK